jgi:HK97 family phage major capsid protein
VQAVTAGEVTNLDAFAEAVSLAEDVGGLTTAFVASPANVLALAQLKRSRDSNEPLLQPSPDPTQATTRQVLGVPLFSSPAVDDETVWAIPQQFSFVVVREDAEVGVDTSAFFTSDRIGIRATLRVGIGWPHEAAIVKIRQRRKLSPHHSTPRPANYRAHLPGCSATR